MFINDLDFGTKCILNIFVGENKLGGVMICIRVGPTFRSISTCWRD